MAGVAVNNFDRSPFGLVQMQLPPQKYAVFSHGGHIAEIGAVLAAIWADALPASRHEAASGPTLEKCGAQFDPRTGLGGFEIWIAVK
jgi:AraC family transcriptional regulator